MTAPIKPRPASKASAATRKKSARRPSRSLVTLNITLRDAVLVTVGFVAAYFLGRLPQDGQAFVLLVLGLALAAAALSYLRTLTVRSDGEPIVTRKPRAATKSTAPTKTLEEPTS